MKKVIILIFLIILINLPFFIGSINLFLVDKEIKENNLATDLEIENCLYKHHFNITWWESISYKEKYNSGLASMNLL